MQRHQDQPPGTSGQGGAVHTKFHFDFDSLPWLTNPRRELHLEGVALGLIRLPPDEGYTFTHRHRRQEEVYMVIEGSGVIQVNEELIPIERGDFVRVAPSAKRALLARETGLIVICAGGIPLGYPTNPNARYLIDDGVPDYDDIPLWYRGDTAVEAKNTVLRQRLAAAGRKKRS